ncbi:MAG: hypothetical protein AMJ53_13475 [Gammaproteobacteria bacterium SG8_11]|nr:MAG: hypothetical protein AMJ53_13475 [Gammaproteobacteria bacterium SG8_11]
MLDRAIGITTYNGFDNFRNLQNFVDNFMGIQLTKIWCLTQKVRIPCKTTFLIMCSRDIVWLREKQ